MNKLNNWNEQIKQQFKWRNEQIKQPKWTKLNNRNEQIKQPKWTK